MDTNTILSKLSPSQRLQFVVLYETRTDHAALGYYLAPSEWKAIVNDTLSEVLGYRVDLAANVLNSIVNKLKG